MAISARKIILGIFGGAALLVMSALVALWFLKPYDARKWLPEKVFFPAPIRQTYNGPGTLIDFTNNPNPFLTGGAVRRMPPLKSVILGMEREHVVYLPPKYSESGPPYPLIIAMHGFMDNPTLMLAAMLPVYETCLENREIPPCVIAFPNLSIGGNRHGQSGHAEH